MKDFTSIYEEFQPKIYRYLRNLTCEADAHDLTQIVFMKVSRSLDGFRGEYYRNSLIDQPYPERAGPGSPPCRFYSQMPVIHPISDSMCGRSFTRVPHFFGFVFFRFGL